MLHRGTIQAEDDMMCKPKVRNMCIRYDSTLVLLLLITGLTRKILAPTAACYHIAKQQQQSGFHQKVNLLQMGCFGSQIVEKLLGSHDQHAVPHNGNAPPLCSHGRALHKAIHSCGLLCDAVCPLEHFCRIHGKGYLSDARAVYVLPAIQTLTTRKRPKLIGIDSLPDSKTSSQAQQKQYQLSFGSDQIESVLGADSPAKQEGININNEANY